MTCFANIAVPQFKAALHPDFHGGDRELCVVHRLVSVPGNCIRFSVLTETGALFHGVPLHLLLSEDAVGEPWPLQTLELWDCFSYWASVYADPLRSGLRVAVKCGDGEVRKGVCLFSIDWCHPDPHVTDPGWSELPDEHKEAHVIELDEGRFAAMPGNRIIWHEPSFVVKPWDLTSDRPPYATNTRSWSAEHGRRTEDSDRMFYEVSE